MDAVEFVLLVEELEPLHVPGDMAGVGHDLEVFHRSNQTLLLLLEISLVGERQRRLRLFQDLQREFRRGLALGMEMASQGTLWSCVCLAFQRKPMMAYCKGRTCGRKGLNKLSSRRHRHLAENAI